MSGRRTGTKRTEPEAHGLRLRTDYVRRCLSAVGDVARGEVDRTAAVSGGRRGNGQAGAIGDARVAGPGVVLQRGRSLEAHGDEVGHGGRVNAVLRVVGLLQ